MDRGTQATLPCSLEQNAGSAAKWLLVGLLCGGVQVMLAQPTQGWMYTYDDSVRTNGISSVVIEPDSGYVSSMSRSSATRERSTWTRVSGMVSLIHPCSYEIASGASGAVHIALSAVMMEAYGSQEAGSTSLGPNLMGN